MLFYCFRDHTHSLYSTTAVFFLFFNDHFNFPAQLVGGFTRVMFGNDIFDGLRRDGNATWRELLGGRRFSLF